MKYIYATYVWIILFLVHCQVFAQTTQTTIQRCGTMELLKQKFIANTKFKEQFEQNTAIFNQSIQQRKSLRTGSVLSNAKTAYTIPVVFHIVLTNPAVVTDKQIEQQLKLLNDDFAGTNADSTKIPSYFKSIFGKSSIRFALAKRTPAGDATTGIERITTTKTSFNYLSTEIKYASGKGADSWDTDKYCNIWICVLNDGILGYTTFPDDKPAIEQGMVIDYRSLPGGSYANYNMGRTLTHEMGHFFNLYHIWGDDDGACTGSDYVEDTPGQANSSTGCYSGTKTDACTSGNGIMYQNYMDYSYDACLVMFTSEQIARMETALVTYRSSLLTSDGAHEAVVTTNNAELKSIDSPDTRLCSDSFVPVVTIRNLGIQPLTSVTITLTIDGNVTATYDWKGSLARSLTTNITLNPIQTTQGVHSLIVALSQPNGQPDEELTNDTLSTSYQYFAPVTTLQEGFEESTFPPTGWSIANPDQGITWQKVTGIARSGNASVKINNHEYSSTDETDDLLLPALHMAEVDSAYLSFYVAAATYTSVSSNSRNTTWDTLQVLVSTDCGKTYTSLYKKYGNELVTRTTPTTSAFVPTSTEWRKDSVNLGNYIGTDQIWIAFRNTTEFENNIYLDDVNLRTVTLNQNLKAKGFLIMPNPTNGRISIQFYPQPTHLQSVQLVSMLGQTIQETTTNSTSPSYAYTFDLSNCATGVYLVKAVFTDHVDVQRIVKY